MKSLSTVLATSRRSDLLVAFLSLTGILMIYFGAVYLVDYPIAKQANFGLAFFELMLIRSFGEEAVYRLIPLGLAVRLFGVRWWILVPVILVSSYHFASMHQNALTPPLYVIGPISVILSVVYLYFGGLVKNELRGFLWVSGVHVATNVTILYLVPLVFF